MSPIVKHTLKGEISTLLKGFEGKEFSNPLKDSINKQITILLRPYVLQGVILDFKLHCTYTRARSEDTPRIVINVLIKDGPFKLDFEPLDTWILS